METKRVHDGFIKVDIVQTPVGSREVVRTSNSVNILLYDSVNQRVLLVRQRREPMDGHITETVAGRFDVNLGPKALAIKEAKEEAGVDLTEDDIVLLNNGKPMALSAGVLTELAYLAFAEVHPEKIEQEEREFGVAEEGEQIVRFWLPVNKLDEYECEDVRVFALLQYLMNLLFNERISVHLTKLISSL